MYLLLYKTFSSRHNEYKIFSNLSDLDFFTDSKKFSFYECYYINDKHYVSIFRTLISFPE